MTCSAAHLLQEPWRPAIGENIHLYDDSFDFERVCAYILSFELHNHSVICREDTILTLKKRKQTQGSEMTELRKCQFVRLQVTQLGLELISPVTVFMRFQVH